MNKRIIKPLLEFIGGGEHKGIWITDFQFRHINYADDEICCSINASINRNCTTFLIEFEDEENKETERDKQQPAEYDSISSR